MRSARDFITLFARSIFTRGAGVASAPLAFISIPIVAVFQFPAHLINQAGHLDLGILANEIVAVLGVPLILILALGLRSDRLMPFRRIPTEGVVLLLAFMIGAVVIMDYLTHASEMILPLPEAIREQLDRVMRAPDARTFVIKLFVLCIVPAFCEEIYFRGFLQTSLAAHWGTGWAVVITSIVFAGMHGNIHYFHLYILLGLIFGWAYAVTGTLWAPIICHVFNNCWTFTNHVREFRIPMGGAPVWENTLIAVAGIALTIVSAYLIQVRMGGQTKDA